MPNKPAARKALRQSLKHREKNVRAIGTIKKLAKEIKKFAAEKKLAEAKERLRLLGKSLDKAARRRIVSANRAGRLKSRMARLVNGLSKK